MDLFEISAGAPFDTVELVRLLAAKVLVLEERVRALEAVEQPLPTGGLWLEHDPAPDGSRGLGAKVSDPALDGSRGLDTPQSSTPVSDRGQGKREGREAQVAPTAELGPNPAESRGKRAAK